MANHNGNVPAVFSKVDLQCWANNPAHRTEELDDERLLVRRGQPFFIALQCTGSTPLPPEQCINLILHLGKEVIKISDIRANQGQWWFHQQEAQSELFLTVHSPADAPVGLYSMTVVLLNAEGHIQERIHAGTFYLLFNPWCKADSVYFPDEEQLQEYILNENGLLYQGSWDQISSLPWNFGQFEKDIVDICFEILDNSPAALRNPEMDTANRADPVYVSRTVTAMVNSNDDRGVVSGRWDGEYSDGVAPTRWTGSVPILRSWSSSGAQRVRYGQCWVFSGVACTVLRCLGIPTRCITNFSSAHDTDGNLTVDYCYNEQLENVSAGKKDMIWNFHCWVESWMSRKDLPGGYDGWQVLDPTPQERSDGVFCCGPCPVKAIKEGEVGVKYDTAFVFSEVNADLVCWIIYEDGQRTQASLHHGTVGRNISTKSVYGEQREDITSLYKYPEGSQQEREMYEKAGRRVSEQNRGSGQLELSIKHVQAVHGTDFDVIVEVQNKGSQDTPAKLTITSNAVTYNSLHLGECQRQSASLTVPAQKVHKEVLRLLYDHYGACLSEHHLIRVTALLQTSSDHDSILQEVNIPLAVPQLDVKVVGEPVVSRRLTTYITFTNPLPITLRGGLFTVEGPGLTAAKEIPAPWTDLENMVLALSWSFLSEMYTVAETEPMEKLDFPLYLRTTQTPPQMKRFSRAAIGPGQDVSIKFSFKPTRAGLRKLLVDFDADRLKDVKGSATVVVRKK